MAFDIFGDDVMWQVFHNVSADDVPAVKWEETKAAEAN